MKIAALFLFVTCLTGSAAYVAATALGGNPVHAQRVPAATDSTPTAAEFAQALVQGTNQFGDGDPIANAHCAKGAPGRYMCSYAVVKATGRECHLMQGRWTPDLPSTITVTLAGRVRRCKSLRAAVHSLDQRVAIEHEFRIQTRWGDFDALGHLNHVSYLVYCDEARDAALHAAIPGFAMYVVARQEIDYRREIPMGTREVVVRTRVVEVGRSSIRLEHDVAGGAATSGAVVVTWDSDARRSRPLTPAERDALTA